MLARRILIVGDGVSGKTLTLALARRGCLVTLLAAPAKRERGSIGEHLPPEALPMLQALGLTELCQDPLHLRSPGLVSQWLGSPSVKDYAMGIGGDGYNLDRAAFDAGLQAASDVVGVTRIEGMLADCISGDTGSWEITVTSQSRELRLEADLIIDATGRSAALARRLGARRQFLDQTLALAGRFAGADQGDCRLLVESVSQGWWYALRQSQDRRVAVYLTDARYCRGVASARTSLWRRAYAETRLIPSLGTADVDEVTVWDARSMVLLPQAGSGWLALGDAAMAFDPISAAGITKALVDAREACEAICNNDEEARLDWSGLMASRARRWRGYVSGLASSYCASPLHAEFWERRARWAAALNQDVPFGFTPD
jgi:flavin-dependent dehydrogenase